MANIAATPRRLIRWLSDLEPTAWLWLPILAVSVPAGTYAEELGLPAPHLCAALFIGLVVALSGLSRTVVPGLVYVAAQAVTGVVIAGYFDPRLLGQLGDAWAPVLVVTLLTLALSLGAGVLLTRWKGVDPATASLGMVAGARPASWAPATTSAPTRAWSPSCNTCASHSWWRSPP